MWYILVDRVYSNWYLNTLEFPFILNLGILSVATLYIGGTGGSQAAATYLSVSIAFTAFLGILFYHIHLQLKDTKVLKTLGKFICGKTQSSTQKADSGPQPMTVTTTFVELPKSGDSGQYSMTSPSTTMVEMCESVASGEHQLKSSSAMSVELREPVLDYWNSHTQSHDYYFVSCRSLDFKRCFICTAFQNLLKVSCVFVLFILNFVEISFCTVFYSRVYSCQIFHFLFGGYKHNMINNGERTQRYTCNPHLLYIFHM